MFRSVPGKKVAFLLVNAIFLFPSVTQAFGLSPALTEIPDMRADSRAERTVYFSRADADAEETIDITFTGESADALHAVTPIPLTFPVGEQTVPFTFAVEPIGFAVGGHTAHINAFMRGGVGAGGSSVAPGLQAQVQFTVVEEDVERMLVDSVSVTPTNENGLLFALSYIVINTGNVTTRPASIQITVRERQSSTVVHEESIRGDEIPSVDPFSEKRITHVFDTEVPHGAYDASVTFTDADGNMLYTSPVLTVTAQQEVGGQPEVQGTEDRWFLQPWVLIATVATLLLASSWFWYRKRFMMKTQ